MVAPAYGQGQRWLVLVLAFILYAVNMASGMYIFGLFLTPLSEAFDWPRNNVALGVTLYFVASGLVSPVVGRLGDRYGHTRIVLGGVVLVGGLLLALSRMEDLWVLYLLYSLLALGNAASGLTLLSAILARRYTSRRGLAMGTAAVGISVGGLLLPPSIQLFIQVWDWRAAFLALGLLTWALGLPVALLLHAADRKPAPLSGEPSASESTHHTALPTQPPGGRDPFPVGAALRSSYLWLLLLAVLFQAAGEVGTLQHQVAALGEAGVAASLGSVVLGLTAGMAVVGRLGTGVLSDRLGAHGALLTTYTIQGLGVAALLGVLMTGNLGFIAPYLLLYGVGLGGCIVGRGLVVADSFGLASYGLLFGLVEMVHQAGAGVGTWVAAYLFDFAGTYLWGLLFFVGAYALSVAVLAWLRPHRPTTR